jgi:hypothetical protein
MQIKDANTISIILNKNAIPAMMYEKNKIKLSIE